MSALSVAQVAERWLSYDANTGKLFRKTAGGGMPAGSEAGCMDSLGYVRVSIGGRQHYAHRLAWLLHYRSEPPAIIDHLNGNKSDNRIVNIRAATKAQNNANSITPPRNKAGVKGVVARPDGRYGAYIKVGGKSKYLGIFTTIEAAAKAYRDAASEKFGAFARQEPKP